MGLFRAAALVWGFVPFLLLAWFAVSSFRPQTSEHWIPFWLWASVVVAWAIAFVVLFYGLLHFHNRGHNVQVAISLLSTVSLGLPAMALGAFSPLSAAKQGMAPRTVAHIPLASLATPGLQSPPVMYIVGVDYSRSFSPREDAVVAAVLARLFGDDGTIGISHRPHDEYQLLAFTEGRPLQLLAGDLTDNLHGKGRRQLVQQLQGAAVFNNRGTLDPKKTDLLGFLRDVSSELQGRSDYSAVRLLVFSDFVQSPRPEGRSLTDRLAALHDIVRALPQLTVVAFRSQQGSAEPDGVDVLRPLREALGEEHFQEVDLDGYKKSTDAAEQLIQPYRLLTSTSELPAGELEVPAEDHAAVPRLQLEMPTTADFDELFFAVDPVVEGVTPVVIRIPGCDGAISGPRELNGTSKDARYCRLDCKRSLSPVVIEVDADLHNAREASGNVVVAIPKRGSFGKIKFHVARFENPAVLWVLLVVLGCFNLVPLGMGLVMAFPRKPELVKWPNDRPLLQS
jgi:hypothetical protein